MPSGLASCSHVAELPPSGIAPLGDQHPTRPLNRRAANASTVLAGRIQPLHIVDGDQHRRVSTARRVDYGSKGRGDHALIGVRALAAGPQQHPVDGDALHVGQLGEDAGVNVAEEVCHCRVGQHRLRLADPRGQHPESPLARLLHRAASHSVVLPMPASPSMTSPDGCCGCRLQELGYRPELQRTAHHAGTHDPPIVSANSEFTDQVPGEQYLALPSLASRP